MKKITLYPLILPVSHETKSHCHPDLGFVMSIQGIGLCEAGNASAPTPMLTGFGVEIMEYRLYPISLTTIASGYTQL